MKQITICEKCKTIMVPEKEVELSFQSTLSLMAWMDSSGHFLHNKDYSLITLISNCGCEDTNITVTRP